MLCKAFKATLHQVSVLSAIAFVVIHSAKAADSASSCYEAVVALPCLIGQSSAPTSTNTEVHCKILSYRLHASVGPKPSSNALYFAIVDWPASQYCVMRPGAEERGKLDHSQSRT